jgi:hypothetical protein
MQRPQLRVIHAALVVGICLFAGCIKTTEQEDATLYTFDSWVAPTAILVSIAAIPLGWALRKRIARLGYGLLILGPIFLIMSPSLLTDRVKVDPQHFEARYGFWWAPNERNVRFDELREIRIKVTESRTRRGGKKKDYSLDCVKKTGETVNVALGTIMQEAAGEIVGNAQASGVPVLGLENVTEK